MIGERAETRALQALDTDGCIKLAHAQPYPSDIAYADNDWDAWDGRHGYFTSRTAVFVS